jgi:hypothetical protein
MYAFTDRLVQGEPDNTSLVRFNEALIEQPLFEAAMDRLAQYYIESQGETNGVAVADGVIEHLDGWGLGYVNEIAYTLNALSGEEVFNFCRRLYEKALGKIRAINTALVHRVAFMMAMKRVARYKKSLAE